MKRAKAMSGQELFEYYSSSQKRFKPDFLEEAVNLSNNIGNNLKDNLKNNDSFEELMNLRQRLVAFLNPFINAGPDKSSFNFTVQSKVICVVSPYHIWYDRTDKDLLEFLESLALIIYPEVICEKISRGKFLNSISDPYQLIRPADFLPKFLAFLTGFEFV